MIKKKPDTKTFANHPGRPVRILILLTMVAVITEFLLQGLFLVLRNTDFSKKNIQGKLAAAASTADSVVLGASTTAETARHILHPYVGFVADPDQNPRVNKLGWVGPDPIGKRSEGTIRIILFGGSVAQQLYESSKDALEKEIGLDNRFRNKKIELYNAALSGYKQPQHLEALAYLLSRGSEYDIVINLDGFNEVALPYAENWQNHVATFYPRGWNFYSKKTVNDNALDAIINIKTIRSKRETLANLFDRNPVKESAIVLALWGIVDASDRKAEYKNTQILNTALTADTPSYQTHGPAPDTTDKNKVFHELAETWYNSSVQMARLSAANNMTYFHFLQPNQHVPNSKRFTDGEQRYIAASAETNENDDMILVNTALYRDAVINGYPLLQKKGEQLIAQQIRFQDLTQIYRNTGVTIYKDSCCHLNDDGNRILVSTIAEAVRRETILTR